MMPESAESISPRPALIRTFKMFAGDNEARRGGTRPVRVCKALRPWGRTTATGVIIIKVIIKVITGNKRNIERRRIKHVKFLVLNNKLVIMQTRYLKQTLRCYLTKLLVLH